MRVPFGLRETGRLRVTGVFLSGSGHNSSLLVPLRIEWTEEQGQSRGLEGNARDSCYWLIFLYRLGNTYYN